MKQRIVWLKTFLCQQSNYATLLLEQFQLLRSAESV